jgi:hypothetical protein
VTASARYANQEQHQRMIDAAATFLEAVAALVSDSQPGEEPAQQEATTAFQAVMIAISQRHPTCTKEVTVGAGLGIGAVFGSTCANAGIDHGPVTQLFADALGHGLVAGAMTVQPVGQA